ncbi:MAG: ABC transporter ATP-binding protein [Candidatus Micrarchaeota archaeon]
MAKQNDIVLKLSNISKVYQMGDSTVNALKDIDLEIKRGESVVIMGPSGSGKSTMLHILGCLDKPSEGEMYLDGVKITKEDDGYDLAEVRNKKIGFVFQFFFLISTLSVVENVELPMIFNGMSSGERRKRAVQLLNRVGLGDRLNHRPSQLSGGQRQRVAVARALANNPAIILADEPTGNLDSKTGLEIMELFEELHKKEGRTIVTVTHDSSLVKHAEKVIRLRDGKIEKIETVRKRVR